MDSTALVAVMAPITKRFEGSIPWMYRDSTKAGIITCAVGQALETLEDALALPWFTPDGGPNYSHPSTRGEITFEYKRVGGMTPGMKAGMYHSPGSPELTDGDITRMLEQDLAGFVAELCALFPEYPTWPQPAQLATLDMAYNMGIGELKKFDKWMGGANTMNWWTCCNQCHRNGINIERNGWTFDQFRAAALGRSL
jgi:hypothetical protein